MTTRRSLLRHFLAALAYRGTNVLQKLPSEIADFRPHEDVRAPREILNHVNSVLTYAHSILEPCESTYPPLADWETEVTRYFDMLQRLDASLAAADALSDEGEERLLQGPLSDAMLHLGQIGIFRRMAGSPVPAENYFQAAITTGELRRPE